MWRIWFFFGILKIGFGAPVDAPRDVIPSSELAVLKCLLSSPLLSCDEAKRSVERIPKRIQKLYEKLKRPLLITNNEVLDSASLETLPTSLLYLIPKVRLSSMTGFTASEIIRRFPFDDALTMKILSLFTDKTNIKQFLNGLADREEMLLVSDDEIIEEESISGIAPISPAVEKEIAHALSRWFPNGSQWDYWLYKASMITGTPILANLPNYYLNSLSLETTEKFLFHLRNWRWDHSNSYDPLWSQHRMSVKRIWANIVLNKAEPPERWSSKILKQFGLILIGATPDELLRLPPDARHFHDFKLLLDRNWNSLQARAIFDVKFSSLDELGEHELSSAKNLVPYLLPRQIQQFSYNVTDFSYVKINSGISLPTEKQLFSSHLAYLISKNNIKNDYSVVWKDQIQSTGKFYHLLPPSALEVFTHENLNLETLMEIDSSLLSFTQARYLTHSGKVIDLTKPETVLKFKGLLKSIPSVELVKLPSNLISQNVKEHLLMFSSGESLPFMASVLEKIKQDFVQTSYLEKMLYSKDFKQYFNLLSSRDITKNFQDFTANLFNVVNRNPVLEKKVRLLPVDTLSSVLSVYRQEILKAEESWNHENLIESPLKLFIFGLTCNDIEVLDTSDFIPIIGYYVRQRRAMNEAFPKNLQYCSQKALTRYLKLKAYLRGYANEPHGLLSLLEPHEIRAVGGYILSGLPVLTISTLGLKKQIISEIGKLSIPELLTATSIENIRKFSEIYVGGLEILNLQIISELGNLVWFFNEKDIERINPKDLKLYMESLEENQVKAFCLNERERNAWNRILIRAFGKPDSWSPGILSTLGDLLFVFDGYELERVNQTSWTEAADILVKTTSFYTTVEWPGKSKPIYLFEACLANMKIPEKISYKSSIKQMLRFYLEATEFLMQTVSAAQDILRLGEAANQVENAPSFSPSVIPPEIAQHFPKSEDAIIKINPSELAKSETSSNEDDYKSDESEEEIHSGSLKIVPSDKELLFSEKPVKKQFLKENKDLELTIHKIESDSFGSSSGIESTTIDSFWSSHTNQEEDSKIWETQNNSEENSLESSQENYSDEEEKGSVYRSKNSKSLEEMKEELQKNASRALIVEVPLNRSEFLNYPVSTKHHIKVSCDAIKMLGSSAGLILDVKDLENMDDTELEDCAEHLGTLNLDLNVLKYVWNRIKKWKESSNLMELGGLVSVIREEEVLKVQLNVTEPWGLENLFALSSNSLVTKLSNFYDQFLMMNMNLQSLNFESATALGPIICSAQFARQKKYLLSNPQVFMNIVKYLGRQLECTSVMYSQCIRNLAKIAKSPEAFGEPHKWTENDVSDLGAIAGGLNYVDLQLQEGKGLRPEAFAGLSPASVACLHPLSFEVLSEEQLSRIPTLSAAAISSEQISSLSPSQFDIVDRVRRQVLPEDLTASYSSSSSKFQPSLTFSMTLSVSIFFVTRTLYYIY